MDCLQFQRSRNDLIDNAGEFNGYQKVRPEHRLLKHPLPFQDGALVLSPGWWPELDLQRVATHCLEEMRITARRQT